MQTAPLLTADAIQGMIFVLRGQRVILDSDLAALYGVPTKRLKEQVKRNAQKFPSDFCFQLTHEELANLRSQNATSSSQHGGHRYLPFAFTEHGALQGANVLTSECANIMSIEVIRAFVRMRQVFATHRAFSAKLEELGLRVDKHDEVIRTLVLTSNLLMGSKAI